jgi:hypothetical protein
LSFNKSEGIYQLIYNIFQHSNITIFNYIDLLYKYGLPICGTAFTDVTSAKKIYDKILLDNGAGGLIGFGGQQGTRTEITHKSVVPIHSKSCSSL